MSTLLFNPMIGSIGTFLLKIDGVKEYGKSKNKPVILLRLAIITRSKLLSVRLLVNYM